MTHRESGGTTDRIMLAIDHFNRRSSAEALRSHGRADDALRFEVQRIVQLGSEVRTRGNLVNRAKEVQLSLVLAWRFDPREKLARIEAYPIDSDTPTPLAATRKPGRRRFPRQDLSAIPEQVEHA